MESLTTRISSPVANVIHNITATAVIRGWNQIPFMAAITYIPISLTVSKIRHNVTIATVELVTVMTATAEPGVW